jgi:hypothetical protein
MYIIDETYVLNRHGQKPDDFPTGLIDSHPYDADEELRAITSDTDVDEVVGIAEKTEGERSTEEKRKLTAFKNAAAELVFFFILPKINVVVSAEGVVTSAQSQKFGDATFKVATPKEIAEFQLQYLTAARKAVRRWAKSTGGILPVSSI